MGWSDVTWSRLVRAGATVAIGILSGTLAGAQEAPRADAEVPAKKEQLNAMVDARSEVNDESAEVQKRIEEISDKTDELLARYRTTLKQIDSIRVYNRQLKELIASQEEELSSLTDQLDQVEVVGRSVTPLMHRMIDALEALVRLDLPFLVDERSERVASLRELMDRSDVTSAEKYRRIMEAYQIENEYGRTIEAYRSSLARGGSEIKVDFLRFGRIALLYQTLDGKESGVWDQEARSWVPLDASYRTPIRQGIRIARKQAAPDLIRLALPAAEGGEG